MENKENWLDEILGTDTPAETIGVNELAASAAGLTHPDDRELEQIMAENWDVPEADLQPEDVLPPEDEPQPEADAAPVEAPAPAAADEELVFDLDFGDEPEQPEPAPEEPETPVKGRPKARKGYGLLGIPHIISTVIWLAIIVVAGISLGRVFWLCCSDIMAFGKPSQSVTITITENDDIDSVSKKLGDAELVRYPGLFKLFATLTGKDERIDAGTYTLNAHLDYNAMINGMVHTGPARETVQLMFPEGYNCAQIFALLAQSNVCTVAELEQWAASGELSDYWFLKGVERGSKYCLEGYLAPDTYEFYTNDEPRNVLEKFLNEFDDRFTDKMQEQFETLQKRYASMLSKNGYGSSYIQQNQLTLHQVVTLASIIEKETSSATESYDIASVFYNRLTNPGNHPYLGSDATVYYAIGDYFGQKKELTAADLQVDSPYNTRNHKGLPPGAICNPGTASLYAALDPSDTSYYYFVYSAKDGKHLFSRTYSEHSALLKELGL